MIGVKGWISPTLPSVGLVHPLTPITGHLSPRLPSSWHQTRIGYTVFYVCVCIF